MLDNHSINGETNEKTYNHVIRNWVKDLRGRSESPSSFKSPNISINSIEEEREVSVYESFSACVHTLVLVCMCITF